jgi:hypothetical protein
MAKIKSTLTGTASGFDRAYSTIYRSETCAGMGGGDHVLVQTNSRPLNSFIEDSSLRSRLAYNWESGTYERKNLDVVENARANINSLRLHPVTNGRHEASEKMQPWMSNSAIMAVPTVTRKKSRKGKK